MKKYLIAVFVASLLGLGACGSHDHDESDHAGHDHDANHSGHENEGGGRSDH